MLVNNTRKLNVCTLLLVMRKKYLNEVNLSTGNFSENSSSIKKAKQIKTQVKTKSINEFKDRWKDKPLQGKYPIRTSEPDLNSLLTYQWLGSSGLKSDTVGFTIVTQDQSRPTRNFQANILENGADPKCKVCDKHTETIGHLGSCCPLLALAKELTQHDRLGQYIHWCLYKNFGLPYQSNWWEHKPPKVIENKNGTILLYLMVPFDIYTDRAIQENRPDIVAKNHGDKNCFLIDICTQ